MKPKTSRGLMDGDTRRNCEALLKRLERLRSPRAYDRAVLDLAIAQVTGDGPGLSVAVDKMAAATREALIVEQLKAMLSIDASVRKSGWTDALRARFDRVCQNISEAGRDDQVQELKRATVAARKTVKAGKAVRK